MLHRSFEDPGWLWLGLLLIPLMGFGWRTFAGLGSTRRWLALGLRSAVVITAVLLLAGPRWSDTASDLTVVAVVDRSESVRRFAERGLEGRGSVGPNRSIEAWAGAWVDEASDDRRPEDRVGWVGFDGEAWIDRLPAASWVFDDALAVESALSPVTGSDLAAAIELGLASHVGDGGLRLMLVSDGNDTSGRAIEAARLAAAAGVPIDVAPLRYRVGDDVRVDGVYAPRRIGLGQTGQVRVVLRAARPSAGRLLLRQDGRWLTGGVAVTPDDWTEDQDGGVVLLRSLDVAFDDERPTRFEAVFEPEDAESTDAVATNNAAEAITLVDGPGKVLLVDGEGGAAGGVLAQALRRRGAQVDRVATSAIPSRLSELLGYRAVIFQNVPYAAISRTAEQALVDYVHDFGGGFAMVGGPQSFGAGGWTYSLTDAALLPVTCEIPAQTLLPSGALVLVIDRSGSMSAPVGQSGQSQQEVAGEAAILAMQTLFPQDLAGVVAFESEAQWVVPLGPNNVERSAEQVRSIRPGGGTNIAPGLALAYRALASSAVEDQALRHVLLLTDGGAPSDGLIEAAQTYADQGISLSVVGVGASGTQRFLLEDLAKAGGGVYYDVADPTRLPQIFIKEALTIRRNLVREAEFVPVRGPIASPVTAGLTAAPPLQGLVITGQRNDGLTFTPLLGPEGEPLFAHRQVGLGRSAAFTSDATARWAGDWLVWEGFADFWKRTVDLVARPPEVRTHEFAMTPAAQGQSLELRLEVFDEPGMAPVRRVLGAVAAPQGGSTTVALERTGPSTFVGSINAEDRGAYLAMLRIERVDGRAESISTTASVRDSAELAAPRDNLPLLQQIAEITGGRVLDVSAPAAGALFAGDRSFESRRPKAVRWQLAPWLLALLLLDVANRRVAWRPESWSAVARAALGALGGSGVRREPVIATAGWSGPRAATATAGVAEQARETARRRDAARRPDRKAVSSVVDDSAQVSRRSSLDKPGAGAQSPSPSPSTATDAANASEAAPESGMQRLLEARRRARERMDGDDSAESR
ncbi:MAG: VWA domain-containing protein [Planctomycetota bacterium]